MLAAPHRPPAAALLPSPRPPSEGKPGDRLPSARGLDRWAPESPAQLSPKGGSRVLGRTGLPPAPGKSLRLPCSTRSTNRCLKAPPKLSPCSGTF